MIFELFFICLIAVGVVVVFFIFKKQISDLSNTITNNYTQLDNKITLIQNQVSALYVTSDQYVPLFTDMSKMSNKLQKISGEVITLEERQNAMQNGTSLYNAISFS